VQSVQVDSAASKLSSANCKDCPSTPDLSTGTLVALRRFSASLQPRSAGSIAATRVTADPGQNLLANSPMTASSTRVVVHA
jgi:hypothetical protein